MDIQRYEPGRRYGQTLSEGALVLADSLIAEAERDKTALFITEEHSHAHDLCLIEATMQKLLRTQWELFNPHLGLPADKRHAIHALRDDLVVCLRSDLEGIKATFSKYRSPYFNLFVNSGFAKEKAALVTQHGVHRSDYALFNRWVSGLRELGRSEVFQKQLAAHERAAHKNYSELIAYMDGLYERYSKLLVVRLDLRYRKQAEEMFKSFDTDTFLQDFQTTQADRVLFRRSLIRSSLGPYLVGYAWKLEYMPRAGFHYHVLLFFNGQQVREDVTLCAQAGEIWKNITDGRGDYWNCNQQAWRRQQARDAMASDALNELSAAKWRAGWKELGVGMVNHADADKRQQLHEVAAYLTKADYFAKLVLPDNGRSFGKGQLPKARNVKRGRPRRMRERITVNAAPDGSIT